MCRRVSRGRRAAGEIATVSGACTVGGVVNGVVAQPLTAGTSGGQVQANAILSMAAGSVVQLALVAGIGCTVQPAGPGIGATSASMTIVRLQ